jgi:hypothetical protein
LDYLRAADQQFDLKKLFAVYQEMRPGTPVDRALELSMPLVRVSSRILMPGLRKFELEEAASFCAEKLWPLFESRYFEREIIGKFCAHIRKVVWNQIVYCRRKIRPSRTEVDYTYRHTRPRRLSVSEEIDLRDFQDELPKLITTFVCKRNRYPGLSEDVCRYLVNCYIEGREAAKEALKNWMLVPYAEFFIEYVRMLCFWAMYEIRKRYSSLLEFGDADHLREVLESPGDWQDTR